MSDHDNVDEGEVDFTGLPEPQLGTLHWVVNAVLFGFSIYFLVWGPIIAASGWVVATVLWLIQGAMSKEMWRMAVMGRLLKAALLEMAKELHTPKEPTEKMSLN